jgi:hypothetical protein
VPIARPHWSASAGGRRVSGGVGRPIKSTSTADSRLPPLATGSRAETLTWPGGNGGSPGGFPRRRRGDGAARHSMTSSTRCGTSALDVGMQICTLAVRRIPSVLPGVGEPAFLGQEEGLVRLVSRRGAHACRKGGK